METFSALLALCAGNSPVPVNSPHKGQWRGALMFSLICAWINGWVNNRKVGDLRRYRAHYDVTVMVQKLTIHDIQYTCKCRNANCNYIWLIWYGLLLGEGFHPSPNCNLIGISLAQVTPCLFVQILVWLRTKFIKMLWDRWIIPLYFAWNLEKRKQTDHFW